MLCGEIQEFGTHGPCAGQIDHMLLDHSRRKQLYNGGSGGGGATSLGEYLYCIGYTGYMYLTGMLYAHTARSGPKSEWHCFGRDYLHSSTGSNTRTNFNPVLSSPESLVPPPTPSPSLVMPRGHAVCNNA